MASQPPPPPPQQQQQPAPAPAQPHPPRGPVSLSGIELLHHEFVSYLLKHHDDGRFASEDLFAKLEQAGYSVGRRFAERLALQRERARPHEVLDVLKWVCRELWIELYQKQIDKLQTNNKGVFVLTDFNFRWQKYVSAAPGEDGKHAALKYLVFPCGLIRGALAACDVDAAVNADLSASPRVIFHVCVGGGVLGGAATFSPCAPACGCISPNYFPPSPHTLASLCLPWQEAKGRAMSPLPSFTAIEGLFLVAGCALPPLTAPLVSGWGGGARGRLCSLERADDCLVTCKHEQGKRKVTAGSRGGLCAQQVREIQ
jgi:hypothetical protein